jgi:hypothetical protein
MSYYPFIDFYCAFLLKLLDYIKIKRIEEHSKEPEDYQSIDIKYVARQLEAAGPLLTHLFDRKI